MRIGRRDFLKLAAAAVAAGRLAPAALARLYETMQGRSAPQVVWLQGAGCDGCAVALLDSIHYASVSDLLRNTLDVKFQNNLMAAAGELAVSAAQAAGAQPGYILIVEGAIPTGASGKYCQLWPGLTMAAGLQAFAANAAYIVALGSCAAFGGVAAGAPNPTAAQGVGQVLGSDPRLINVSGCPAHPDRLAGTLVYLINNGHMPPLDAQRRPLEFYGQRVHDNCFKRQKRCGQAMLADKLGDEGCLEYLGCKGKQAYSDCPLRKWNAAAVDQFGVNWCVGARSPCLGCVEPSFPDGMSPFYVYSPTREGLGQGNGHDDDEQPPRPGPRRQRRSRAGSRRGAGR
jgi:NiFe hydrogenase small subunit HydA